MLIVCVSFVSAGSLFMCKLNSHVAVYEQYFVTALFVFCHIAHVLDGLISCNVSPSRL